jgi:hypothetical protein
MFHLAVCTRSDNGQIHPVWFSMRRAKTNLPNIVNQLVWAILVILWLSSALFSYDVCFAGSASEEPSGWFEEGKRT